MTRPILIAYWLFSVHAFFMCSAGYSGSWSDGDNVSTLNNILRANGWKQLVKLGLDRELKSIDGKRMDVSALLDKGTDGNIVTPVNYTDKLVKSSTVVNCFYSESLKFLNDLFIEIIAGHCMSLDSDASKLDCMERFWKTMDINKALIDRMLVVLNFFHNASSAECTRIVINALESLKPHYNRQKYIKSNYSDDNDTLKMDSFEKDCKYFLDKMTCANIILRDFLKDHCLPICMTENKKSDDIIAIERVLANFTADQIINKVFKFYVESLIESEKSFLTRLGIDKVQ